MRGLVSSLLGSVKGNLEILILAGVINICRVRFMLIFLETRERSDS